MKPAPLLGVTSSTLEGLAKRELNLGALLGKSAEARERRLIPEVIEDFFVTAGPIAGVHPKPVQKDGHVYRVGKDGTPLRRTPWGEIAFQLGREEGFAVVAKHDEEGIAPSTEVIRKFLPKDKPALILMDELLNYLNRERNRKTGLGGQLYSFVQNLSEEARAQDRVVLAVSLPSSHGTRRDQAGVSLICLALTAWKNFRAPGATG